MDAIKLLKTDHEKVKDLLENLSKTTERGIKTREKLFRQLQKEVKLHEQKEEKIFYPAMQAEDKKLVLEAYEEHRVADTMLELLDRTPFDDETWSAKLKVLKENLLHHIKEEEKIMFKEAKLAFDQLTLQKLGNEMASL